MQEIVVDVPFFQLVVISFLLVQLEFLPQICSALFVLRSVKIKKKIKKFQIKYETVKKQKQNIIRIYTEQITILIAIYLFEYTAMVKVKKKNL